MERRSFVCSINYISGMCLWGAWLSGQGEEPSRPNDRINRLRVGGLSPAPLSCILRYVILESQGEVV